MRNPLAWYRKRKRARSLGYSFRDNLTGRPVRYWHDPETDDVWMAEGRWRLFTVDPVEPNPESIIDRLDKLPMAVLEVDPDDG